MASLVTTNKLFLTYKYHNNIIPSNLHHTICKTIINITNNFIGKFHAFQIV